MKWGKIMKVIGNLLTTFLFLIVVLTVFMIVSSKLSGEEPNLFGYQMKTVLSGSMEPKIQTGSIIFIQQFEKDEILTEGDVITFLTEEDILVTHRIIEINGNEFITKGDNNNGNDIKPVLSQNIIGKYTGITIPFIGYGMGFAKTKLGSALLLILPGLYLIGYSFIIIGRLSREIEDTKNDEIIAENKGT